MEFIVNGLIPLSFYLSYDFCQNRTLPRVSDGLTAASMAVMTHRVRLYFFFFCRDGRVLVTYGGKEAGMGRAGRREGARGAQKQQQQYEDEEEPSVKFVMLNPSVHFDEVVQKVLLVVNLANLPWRYI